MNKRKIMMLTIIIAAIFIIGCILFVFLSGFSEIKIGYFENTHINELEASFKYYDGKRDKKVKFNEGDEVTISYDIEVEDGAFQVSVNDEDGNEIISKSDGNGEVKFVVDKTQEYSINISAQKAKGDYKIKWDKK